MIQNIILLSCRGGPRPSKEPKGLLGERRAPQPSAGARRKGVEHPELLVINKAQSNRINSVTIVVSIQYSKIVLIQLQYQYKYSARFLYPAITYFPTCQYFQSADCFLRVLCSVHSHTHTTW